MRLMTYAIPGAPLSGGIGMSGVGACGVPATPSARRHDVFWRTSQAVGDVRVVKPTDAKQARLPQPIRRARYLT